jgi:hypothetical protein
MACIGQKLINFCGKKMTWDLDTHIDLSRDPFECVKALTDFFESDLENIQYEVITGRWSEEKTLEKGELVWHPNTLSDLENLLHPYLQSDNYRYITVGLGLHGYGDFSYSPYPEIAFYSQSQRKGGESVGQKGDAVLMFGNHNAYRIESVLPKSGRLLDRNFIVETLKHICLQIQPKNLYLLSEEQVYIPWNYHFIFHNSPQGYAQDLADLIQLVLHGGDERFVDGRRTYEIGVSENFGMTFCKRKRNQVEILQQFMLEYGVQIEEQGLPETLSEELIEGALLEASNILSNEEKPMMNFFFAGDGLGIYAQPLFGGYLDAFFIVLMAWVKKERAVLETANIT